MSGFTLPYRRPPVTGTTTSSHNSRSSSTYVEVQHFPAYIYVSMVSIIVLTAMIGVSAAETTVSTVAWSVAGILSGFFALFGRVTIRVNDRQLAIIMGWVGLVRLTIPLRKVTVVQVCAFKPLINALGIGIHESRHGISFCLNTHRRRGVRIAYGGRHLFLGSADPMSLKRAIMRLTDSVEPPSTIAQLQRTPHRLARSPHKGSMGTRAPWRSPTG